MTSLTVTGETIHPFWPSNPTNSTTSLSHDNECSYDYVRVEEDVEEFSCPMPVLFRRTSYSFVPKEMLLRSKPDFVPAERSPVWTGRNFKKI